MKNKNSEIEKEKGKPKAKNAEHKSKALHSSTLLSINSFAAIAQFLLPS
jgi:hypothetical protein